MRAALRVALSSTLFTALVQIESAWMRAAPSASFLDRLSAVGIAALVQYQAVVIGALLGVLTLIVHRSRSGRALVVIVFAATQLLIVADQLAYRAFGEHMAVAQLEGGPGDFLPSLARVAGSALAVATAATWINLALLVALTAFLAKGMNKRAPRSSRTMLLLSVSATTYVLAGAVISSRAEAARAPSEYPLRGLFAGDAAAAPALGGRVRSRVELERALDSTWRASGPFASDQALLDAAAQIGARHVRPNIVLVVLESVGSEQLLDHDSISAARTPSLARWSPHAVVFPYVYGFYPATTRAHVPLMTGGRTPTWGALADELDAQFAGPTIPSELKARGYHTGLFAAPDLRFGYLRELYRRMPWDTLVHYLDGSGSLKADQEIHSWGVNEDAARLLATNWTRSAQRDGRPFFLEFHTIATHHPYEVWGADRAKVQGAEDRTRYQAALRYTDAAIGRLMDDLAAQGALDNTIVAITGDHGEAFSEKHAGNWLHRSFLYEENIRESLILLAPRMSGGPLVSGRLAGTGDVMPTLLRLAGGGVPGTVPGQDLFSTSFTPRVHYFYKDTGPAQLGLRDGRWKFIVHRDGTAPQLFDLSHDPDEQRNLAADQRARIAAFTAMTTEWYVGTDKEYSGFLAGWDSTKARQVTRRALTGFEPPKLQVGHWGEHDGDKFVERAVMAPHEKFVVLTTWTDLIEDIPVRLQFVSPGHVVRDIDFLVRSDNETTWYTPDFNLLEEGRWHVSLWRGGRRIGQTNFQVSFSELPALRKR